MTSPEEKLRKIIDEEKPKSFSYEGKKVYINKDKIQEIKELENEHEGGILPLVALLPLIFGGLTAAGATAASVANVVKNAKESRKADAEANLANSMVEKIKSGNGQQISLISSERGQALPFDRRSGSGIFLDRFQGNGLTKYLKNFCKDEENSELKRALKKLGKGEIEITRNGEGLFLNPYNPNIKNND